MGRRGRAYSGHFERKWLTECQWTCRYARALLAVERSGLRVSGWVMRVTRSLAMGAAFAVVAVAGLATWAAPEVRRVAISSSAGPDLTYGAGDRISVTVQFDENVEVTGSPALVIGVGGRNRHAPMCMHSGSRLHFGYTVDAVDQDPDGISVPADGLRLGRARIVAGDAAADVSLEGYAIAEAAAHKVDGPGARAPRLERVALTSDPGPDGTYAITDEIEVTAEFDEGVEVTGLPWVSVQIGEQLRRAVYRTGSGTSRLRFVYVVAPGDEDESGVSLPANGLGGADALRDPDGNVPRVRYEALPEQAGHAVDGIAPRVTGVEVVSEPANGKTYGVNEAILVEVTFDEDVFAADTGDWGAFWIHYSSRGDSYETWDWQWLWLRVGKTWRGPRAMAVGGRSAVFRHLVAAGDMGSGLTVGGGDGRLARAWPGITDAAGNAAGTSFGAAPVSVAASVDGTIDDDTAPSIQDVRIVSRPRGDVYRAGEQISIWVVFSEDIFPVDEEGNRESREAVLTLQVGERAVEATGWVHRGWGFALFRYVVGEGDIDVDGVSVPGDGLLLGGRVEDRAGNVTERAWGFDEAEDDAAHGVNGSVSASAGERLIGSKAGHACCPQGGVLREGVSLLVALTFGGPVKVTGAPDFVIGENRRQPRVSVQPTHVGATRWRVWFRYAVAGDDIDADGFSVPAQSWSSVRFEDRHGEPIEVDLAELVVENQGVPISGKAEEMPAQVVGVRLALPRGGAGIFGAGESIQVSVVFDNVVTVRGTPRLKLGGHELPCLLEETGLRLVCQRVVAQGENAENVVLTANALIPEDAVQDASGNAVDLGLEDFVDGVEPFSIDGVAPTIRRMAITSRPVANNTYGAGAYIDVVVQFDEAVEVTGTPQLALDVGDDDATRLVALERRAGATGLVFRYRVTGEDEDATGISIASNAIRLTGGTIADAAGNAADLSQARLGDRGRHRVDGSVADVSSAPVQIWIGEAPGAATGSAGKAASATLTWEMRSTWADQPRAYYRVTSDRPDVHISRSSGWATPDTAVTNTLTLPCPSQGTVNTRVTVKVKEAVAPVVWDVLCRYGRLAVQEVELFQGPLVGAFGAAGFARAEDGVPAIAGRAAVLRVRLDHEGSGVPDVALQVTGPDGLEDIGLDYVGTQTDKRGRTSTVLAHVPAEMVTSEHGLDIALDPVDRLDDDAEGGLTGEFSSLELLDLPMFKPVLVPIEVASTVPDLSGDVVPYLGGALAFLPIGDMEPRVVETLRFEPTRREEAARRVEADRLLLEMRALWNRDAEPDEYYVGILHEPPGWQLWSSSYGGRVGGQGGGTVSHNRWDGPHSALTIAHEVGHCFGLAHAPCGDPPGVDPDFPFQDGGVGPGVGWSSFEGRFVAPGDAYFDLMSYCWPQYISSYHYEKATVWGKDVRDRLRRNESGEQAGVGAVGAATGEVPPQVAPDGPRAMSLALSGSVDGDGAWSLFAATTSDRSARVDEAGEFQIGLFDEAGVELYRTSLATEDVSHSRVRTWAVRVPIQARSVRAVRVRDAGGDLRLDAPVTLPGGDLAETLR